LYVHRHGPHIWQLIVKIMFQIQTHELNPVIKSVIKCGLDEWKLRKNMLHLFWNCNLVQHFWFYVNNVLKIYVITLSLNTKKITLGISKKYFENRNQLFFKSSKR
jgi:hypothetical protein